MGFKYGKENQTDASVPTWEVSGFHEIYLIFQEENVK